MRKRAGLIELTSEFTPADIAKLEAQREASPNRRLVLTFETDGIRQSFRIVSTAGGRVFARATRLYHPDEVQIKDRVE